MRPLLFLAFVIVGCQSGAVIGTTCTSASSCASPLVCRLGRCRTECAVNRDCPVGAQCFLDQNAQGACELDVDHSCGDGSCGAGLTCLSETCVRACTGPAQCPSDGECTLASGAPIGVCSDPRDAPDAAVPMDAAVLPDAYVAPDAPSQRDAAMLPDMGSFDAGACAASLTAAHIAVGEGSACAIRTDGTVVCWGGGDNNELGTTPGTTCAGTACATMPIVVPLAESLSTPLSGAMAIGAGEGFACALLTNHHVRCWGRDHHQMLGVDGVDGQPGAFEVLVGGSGAAIDDASELDVAEGHACVVRADGHLWCWGYNDNAQLGLGLSSGDVGQNAADATVFDAFVPFERAFVMSGDTCIIQSSGAVWCVGDETHLELGPLLDAGFDAGIADWGDQPRQIDITLGSLHVVSGGGDFACGVIAADRSTRCWGWDINGAFGDGSSASEDSATPLPMTGTGASLMFSALFGNTTGGTMCGVAGGSFYCWGSNDDGRAGFDPDVVGDNPLRATHHTDLPPIDEASCGQQGCCAIDTSHHVWCWGDNNWGQLGRGAASAFEWRPALVGCP